MRTAKINYQNAGTLAEARKNASYWGRIVRSHENDETVTTPEEKRHAKEMLSHHRSVILQKNLKTKKNVSAN